MNFNKIAALTTAGVMALSMTATAEAASGKLAAGKGQTAKNVIVMIADGWGSNQILAANYFNSGKAINEAYEKFPTRVDMSTYSVSAGSYDPLKAWDWTADPLYINNSPTDSAAAGTTMSTGVKTYDNGIGVDVNKVPVKHISEYFEEEGKATGVVSSVQFYHATPAAFVAHDVSRNSYNTIAAEMIYDSAADVIMAPGHPGFNDDNEAVELNFNNFNKVAGGNTKAIEGSQMWAELSGGAAGGDANGDGAADAWNFIQTKEEFEAMTTGETPDRVFGLPQVATTLQQGRSGDAKAAPYKVAMNENVPDLATMTKAALNVLDNNKKGLFLMVEGGAIDWAGHANQLGRNIEEMNDFNNAVDSVIEWVNTNSSWGETLLIVTGDHETGFLSGSKGKLSPVINNGAGAEPSVFWNSGNHTNQLVPLYAKGQGADLIKKYADEKDPVLGSYTDNSELFPVILDLLK